MAQRPCGSNRLHSMLQAHLHSLAYSFTSILHTIWVHTTKHATHTKHKTHAWTNIMHVHVARVGEPTQSRECCVNAILLPGLCPLPYVTGAGTPDLPARARTRIH